MPLDSRYVIAPSLQEYFVDKDTGLPLSGGKVYFYEDNARTIPKDVFEIVSGSIPNDYSYNVLPNPVTLSAVGTFQNNVGNDIIPYYYPFDDQGNIDLYYIEVYDSGGVLQFTREAWPNFTTEDVSTDRDITNFIPNGQFLLHDNIPASSANGFIAGKISADTTVIAQGGWSFERGPASTATDIVTFPRYGSAIQSPTGNPRYAFQVQTTVAGSDTRKDLCLKFPDVNTFASDTQSYNLYFEGQSATGSDITNCQLIVRKVFGTGGTPSATTETLISTFSLTASTITKYNIEILFDTNEGKSIGTNNDDYVQIVWRFPPTGVQTAQITDVALTVNDTILTSYPDQTDAQQIDPSTAGWFPTPDANGNDLYCPAILGPSGLTFDHSSIGEIVGLMVQSGSQTGNLLYCDGSAYLAADYSSLGIPYSRLKNVLFNSSANGTIFGTGANFSNANISTSVSQQLILTTNKAGAQTNPSDGSTATGFTFNAAVNTGTAGLGYVARANQIGNVIAKSTGVGSVTLGVSAGTSGMTLIDLKQNGVAGSYYAFEVAPVSAAALTTGGVGLYFDFSSLSVNYRMWFKPTTEVAPAAGGRTLIQVNLTANMSLIDVGLTIAAVLSGFQTNTIQVGALPPVSSFFTFNANAVTYYVWYQINGVGTAPSQPFAQLIPVALTGAETAAQVAFKTQTAINSQYFAVPDLRGYFLRGNDPAGTVDVNAGSRYGYYNNTLSYLGTYQVDEYTQHHHELGNTATGGAGSIGSVGSGQFTGLAGGFETRPVNVAVNYFIRY